MLAECVRSDKLLHPFIYPKMCPVSLDAYIPIPPFPPLQFPPPLSLPAATNHRKPERTEETLKKKERGTEKTVKEGNALVGSCFLFNKRAVGIHLRPIC